MEAEIKQTLNSISEKFPQLRPWILGEDGRTPVRTDLAGYLEWAVKTGGLSVRVALDEIDGTAVSTVFLDQMSMAGDRHREPDLFETLVSDANGGAAVERRYRTWDEAERGHAEIIEELRHLAPSSPKP
ncbi:hypothetical protein HFO56_39570 [Rhizobium laguerreae]|uniref:hypothetical protein n=1 Tax=Rhizobium laguerreae TaxID=1076926 RepID=UPI001C91109D|nr:hypothetical protein [Rhizobium laguerreae]MBY3158401.1 hypothetical protein [Rhizobium laguerreae]